MTRERCGAVCPDEPDYVCERAKGHIGRHEGNGGDWYDDDPDELPPLIVRPGVLP